MLKSDSSCEDLGDEHGAVVGGGELVDHDLTGGSRNGPGEWSEHVAGQGSCHVVENVAEVGEHDHTAADVLGLFDDLDEPSEFRGLVALRHRALAHSHELADHDRAAIGRGIFLGQWEPLVDLDVLGCSAPLSRNKSPSAATYASYIATRR